MSQVQSRSVPTCGWLHASAQSPSFDQAPWFVVQSLSVLCRLILLERHYTVLAPLDICKRFIIGLLWTNESLSMLLVVWLILGKFILFFQSSFLASSCLIWLSVAPFTPYCIVRLPKLKLLPPVFLHRLQECPNGQGLLFTKFPFKYF
jgi:hypothetical protein